MGLYAVTGGASGIGAALIATMVEQGHTTINIDIKDADIMADLSTREGRQQAIAGVLERAPDGLDGFVPVAGIAGGVAPGPIITAVNYYGTVDMVAGLRTALAQKQGSVVLLASNSAAMEVGGEEFVVSLLEDDEATTLAAAAGVADGTHYMLSKRALIFWMQRNAMSYGRDGIRLNAVAPGPVLTPMTAPLFASAEYGPIMQGLLDATPIHRAAQPEEIADCVVFLLSSAASYVSGSLLFVDGGYDANTRQNHL
ncbi:MAG: NAD(P)-dependent dehydrogenase (short-subunit alcohol dehydrogenase family) [Halieaceae bacterium]|jgi:NAD(P)-dependent dehydrogenase (short-subunit alcohol dehydrogenase family)